MVSELNRTVWPAVRRTVARAASIEGPRGELLTEARDDEEAEVDRQADPQGDDQVESEDRQRRPTP